MIDGLDHGADPDFILILIPKQIIGQFFMIWKLSDLVLSCFVAIKTSGTGHGHFLIAKPLDQSQIFHGQMQSCFRISPVGCRTAEANPTLRFC